MPQDLPGMKSVEIAARLCSCCCQAMLWFFGDFLSLFFFLWAVVFTCRKQSPALVISSNGCFQLCRYWSPARKTDKPDWYARTRTKGNQDPWPGTRPRPASRSQQLESVDVQWGSNQTKPQPKWKLYALASLVWNLPCSPQLFSALSLPSPQWSCILSSWSLSQPQVSDPTPTPAASLPISAQLHPYPWPERSS